MPELQKILLRRRVAAFGLSAFLSLATLLWTASSGLRPIGEAVPGPLRPIQAGIDPNTARWFELAQLPGIGEALSKRIKNYRLRNRSDGDPAERVFRTPADLAQVKGIGEKTVRRIGPFLRFGNSNSGKPR